MKPKYENPSFLNASKIQLHIIDHSNSQVSSKKNIHAPSSRKKNHRPVVSFLNFCKNKMLSANQNQPQVNISSQAQGKKEETFEFHEFQEGSNHESQIGSQYGQINYDNELKQVLKRQRRPLRKQYHTPKVSLRINSQQKENFQQLTSKYERFQKFQTQMQKKDPNIKQESTNYEAYDLQGCDNKKPSGFSTHSQNLMHQVKTEFNSKHQEFINDSNLPGHQQKKLQNKRVHEYNPSGFKPFQMIDSATTFQAIEFKKIDKNISPLYRRSRTYQDLPTQDNEKAEHIFQNYRKLKKKLFKSPKHQDHSLDYHLQPTTPTNIQLCEKQTTAQENHSKLRKDDNKNYRSLPKCHPLTLSQNIYCINLPSGRGVAPKSLARKNIDDKTWAKMINQRKKDYFKTTDKSFDLSNYTFDQIKQKLLKLELNENKKTHNKSHKNLGNKNVLLYSELFVNGQKKKQDEEETYGKQKSIKFKGIAFKANLLRKHTDIYEKQAKKMTDKKLSVKVTPKDSQTAMKTAI